MNKSEVIYFSDDEYNDLERLRKVKPHVKIPQDITDRILTILLEKLEKAKGKR